MTPSSKLRASPSPRFDVNCQHSRRDHASQAYESHEYYRPSINCAFKAQQKKLNERVHIFGPRVYGP